MTSTAAPEPSAAPSPGQIPPHLHVEALGAVHYVHFHLGIPLVRRVTVSNAGDRALGRGRIEVTFSPPFASVVPRPFESIPAGASVDWEMPDIQLDAERLAANQERIEGRITIRVVLDAPAAMSPTGSSDTHRDITSDGRPDGCTAEELSQYQPVSLLAFNEWPGLCDLPELLAAYVTPNQSCINEVLHLASAFLQEVTGNGSLDGYQSGDPRRVLRIAESVYRAVQTRQLTYVSPPPSYEAAGQKVRFAEVVWQGRQAACLDLALFFAGAFEAAGLHPLICVEKGHAYAGCWLLDERHFDLAFEDDVQALRKGADLHALCVFEATNVTQPGVPFAVAEQAGRVHLDNDTGFRWALDIARARSKRVRPLPISLDDGRLFVAPEPDRPVDATPVFDAAAVDRRFAQSSSEATAQARQQEPPAARVARWQRQLLDLSLRNRLLNLQERSCIRLLPGNLGALEDHLADAGEVRFVGKAPPDPRAAALHAQRTQGESLSEAELEADLADHKLRTDEPAEVLLRKLVKLEREAQVALDESGSNTLFLALGILEWREHGGASAKTRRAPLLLMPVQLVRRSVRSGFRLRRRDEDTQVNVTLLEKLKREFDITVPDIDPPPLDQRGVDVAAVLHRIRHAVLDVPGFEVREEAFLGLFSFTKFLLWRDLGRQLDALKRNAVVAHLVDHWGAPFVSASPRLTPADLDRELPPHESFNVLEADSTQLAAMANAGRDQHFVLNGPPGTGKSQTIANMVSHCLALGKSVLFVAEKKTALEVVQRRLEKVGLGPFCLELHSNKAGKTDFIRQLRDAVEFGSTATPAEWQQTADDLQRARDHLNGFVTALHRRCPNGLSAYGCFNVLIPSGGRAGAPLALAVPDPTIQTLAERQSLRNQVEELALRLAHFPQPANHPLTPLGPVEFTLSWEAETLEQLAALEAALAPVAATRDAAAGAIKLDLIPRTAGQLAAFAALCGLLRRLPDFAPALLRHADLARLRTETESALAAVQKYRAAQALVADYDETRLLALDAAALERTWDELESKFAVTRWLGRRTLLKQLVSTRRQPGQLAPDDVRPLLQSTLALAATRQAWETANAAMGSLFGSLWRDGAPDPAAIASALEWLEAFQGTLGHLVGDDFMAATTCRERLAGLAEHGRMWLAGGQPGHAKLQACEAAWNRLLECHRALARPGLLDLAWDASADLLADLAQQIADLRAHQRDWQRWTLLQQSRQRTRAAGLTSLEEALARGALARADAAPAFDRAYAWETLRRLLDREKLLLNFFGEEYERSIRQFRDLDTRLVELNQKLVVSRLAAGRPDGLHDERALGEVAILRTELVKKTKFKPVRELLNQLPHTLRRIKPCVLMSPLSVAQYLDPTQPPFDVVIFDEASQIPVCDAIGALARGRQSIVAGDPRQLPPTSFFQKLDLDLDDNTDPDAEQPGQPLPPDQESILDECLAAQIPEQHLDWHYRSRRESLIAFSNQHYYGNRLLTFPAPEAEERGVFLHPVGEGFYDRGHSRTNRAEAETVVAAVREHLIDPARADVSLAVITFNTEQMTLIENLLDAAREQDAAFDEAMRARTADHLEEPFKVRNLESIQGDERDVIFFSITYGPDRTGYVSHNFGPINKPGGERRLNVAVTRAKQEVHVYTTLRAADIDLRRTGARGVLDLKNYLAFAEHGVSALAQPAGAAKEDEYDSEFERFVATALRERGWIVQTQVGCSGYRIDLAVVHPDAPGRFLAGVECDGASYHRAATARDRDRLRQSFLENLGWHILRVWSTDWFRNAANEIERLDRELRLLRHRDPAVPFKVEEPPAHYGNAPRQPAADDKPAPPPVKAAAPPPYTAYRACTPGPAPHHRESFHEPAARTAIAKQIGEIMDLEAPISESVLIERIRLAWGFGRAGGRIIETIRRNQPRDLAKIRHGDRLFLWRTDQDPHRHDVFRGGDPDDPQRRKLEEIPPEEVAAAMAWLVRRFGSAAEEDLLRETAAVFGWKALTSAARQTLRPALELILARGFSREDGDMIRAGA